MDDDTITTFRDYLAERADRPFGDVEWISGRVMQPFSIASQQAASNLLGKAFQALNDGNLDRARAMVGRAVRLPYDEHERAAPAAMAVHMELFSVVTDALESADHDDPRWLDAALEALATADERARFDLRDVLSAIDQDFSLTKGEHSRIRAALAPIPDRARLMDLELTPTELGDHVMSILTARRDYQAAFAHTR